MEETTLLYYILLNKDTNCENVVLAYCTIAIPTFNMFLAVKSENVTISYIKGTPVVKTGVPYFYSR